MTFQIHRIKKPLLERTSARRMNNEREVARRAIAASIRNDPVPEMALELRPIESLKPAKKRVRKTSPEQLNRVMNCLSSLGQRVPITVDERGTIINGHIVIEALKRLGATHVWCVVIDNLDEDEKDLLHVALNRIAELGEWDIDALGPLLIELDDVGLDLTLTGFSLPELDILMQPAQISDDQSNEEIQEPPPHPVSQLGDLWQLGKHFLLCGDATLAESYVLVLNGELAACVFTDCPWNLPAKAISGLGKKKHEDFKMGAGEMSDDEFAGFANGFTQLCADHLEPGGAFFSCVDWRSYHVIHAAALKAGLKPLNLAVWNKGSGGMGSYLRSAHELIPIFCKGDKLAVNNVELGKHGRYRSNVWNYAGANQRGSSAAEALADHPTPKNLAMVEDALLDVTNRGAIVLDPFLGSGTTLLAAELSGRRARTIELDPGYVDVAIRRWEAITSEDAVHLATGLTYRELAAKREVGDCGQD